MSTSAIHATHAPNGTAWARARLANVALALRVAHDMTRDGRTRRQLDWAISELMAVTNGMTVAPGEREPAPPPSGRR